MPLSKSFPGFSAVAVLTLKKSGPAPAERATGGKRRPKKPDFDE